MKRTTMTAEIVVQSHLSDSLIELGSELCKEDVYTRIRFCKYLIGTLAGDLSREIDPDEMFEKFSNG